MKYLQKIAVLVAVLYALPSSLLAADNTAKQLAADSLSAPLSAPLSGMRPSADLGESLEAYRQVTMQNNVDGILSFVYPPVFKLVPKEQIKKMLTQLYASGNAPVIKAIDFKEVGPVRSYGKGQFSVINYEMEIELPRPGDATPEIDQKMIEVLKKKMGAQTQVAIDEERNILTITKMAVLLAINEQKTGWKVLEKQKLEMIRQDGLLPEDLLAQLK